MAPGPIITLDEARQIREQLRPAFAGYVTDGNISDRDVLATLMDLVVRGCIGMEAETQKQPVKIHRIFLISVPETLLHFEKVFLKELFSGSRELTCEQVRQKMATLKLHYAIANNLTELSRNQIVGSRLLILDKKGRKLDLKDYSGRLITNTQVLEDYRVSLLRQMKFFILMLLTVAVIASLVFFGYIANGLGLSRYTAIPSINLFVLLPLALLIFAISSYRELGGLKKFMLFQFENDIVPFTKKKYEELFDFIHAYPLKMQRIYNEFMPHAVAFGLDTSWNKSFGVLPEHAVASRAISCECSLDFPDRVYSKRIMRNIFPFLIFAWFTLSVFAFITLNSVEYNAAKVAEAQSVREAAEEAHAAIWGPRDALVFKLDGPLPKGLLVGNYYSASDMSFARTMINYINIDSGGSSDSGGLPKHLCTEYSISEAKPLEGGYYVMYGQFDESSLAFVNLTEAWQKYEGHIYSAFSCQDFWEKVKPSFDVYICQSIGAEKITLLDVPVKCRPIAGA